MLCTQPRRHYLASLIPSPPPSRTEQNVDARFLAFPIESLDISPEEEGLVHRPWRSTAAFAHTCIHSRVCWLNDEEAIVIIRWVDREREREREREGEGEGGDTWLYL